MKRGYTLIYRIATTALLIACTELVSFGSDTAAEGANSRYALTQAAVRKAKTFDDFVAAIHQVETTGKTGRIYGDGRRSLGPLQISQAAWRDATRFDPSIRGSYAHCKDLEYSKKIMLAYLQKYDPIALEIGDWETCARLWNSGPAWYMKVRLTNRYWAQVRHHLARQAS